MKCCCKKIDCENEMQFDSDGMTILCSKAITLSGVKTHEEILFYVTPISAQEIIDNMRDFIPPVEPIDHSGTFSDGGDEEDHDPDAFRFRTCPSCSEDTLAYGNNFCSNCGAKVNWTFGHLANQ